MIASYSQRGFEVRWSLLQEAQVQPKDQVILVADFDEAVLPSLQDNELKSLQSLAQTASHILWVTFGGLLSGQKPEHAMVWGLARCLRAENLSLDLVTIDCDTRSNTIELMTQTIAMIADKQADSESASQAEYLIDNGILYTARLTPIDSNIETCAPITGEPSSIALRDNSGLKATTHSGKLCFKLEDEEAHPLAGSEAEVQIMAAGLHEAVSSKGTVS